MVRRFKIVNLDLNAEYFEQWLQELASKGYILHRMGDYSITFEECVPAKMRYHIEPVDPKEGPERIAVLGSLGWNFWGEFQDHNVFFADLPEAKDIRIDDSAARKLYGPRLKSALRGFVLFLALALFVTISYLTRNSYSLDPSSMIIPAAAVLAAIISFMNLLFVYRSFRNVNFKDLLHANNGNRMALIIFFTNMMSVCIVVPFLVMWLIVPLSK